MKNELPIGRKINSLLLLREMPKKHSSRMVECECDCGNVKTYYYGNIKSGASSSCGCKRNENVKKSTTKHNEEDYINKKFGRLTILNFRKNSKYKSVITKCDCGIIQETSFASILAGKSQSCGCLRTEILSEKNGIHFDSGKKSEHYRLFSRWNGIMQGCLNKKSAKYKNLGAYGVKICDEWRDYRNFKEYVLTNLGDCPDGHKLQRIDIYDDFKPGNLMWTKKILYRTKQKPNINKMRTLTDEQIKKLKHDDFIHVIYEAQNIDNMSDKEKRNICHQLLRILMRNLNNYNYDFDEIYEEVMVYENDKF